MLKKSRNPKDVAGSSKVPLSAVPMPVIMEVAAALHEGGLKYGRFNWRKEEIAASAYFDALQRHLCAWFEREDVDEDSGLNHVVKAIATLVVLRDSMIRGKMVDDRPPGTTGFIDDLNKKCTALNGKYPDGKPPVVGTGEQDKYRG